MSGALPADPFGRDDTAWVTLHEIFAGLRRGGFSLVEASMVVAAAVTVNSQAGPPAPGSRQEAGS